MSTESTTPAPSPWNLPNALTVMRILLVPVFVWLVLRQGGDDVLDARRQRGHVVGLDGREAGDAQLVAAELAVRLDVDDDPDAADTLASLLRQSGCEVWVAYTGYAALDAFYQRFDPQHFFIEGALQHADHGPATVFDRREYPNANVAEAD